MMVLGEWLDFMILEVFSNLWFYASMNVGDTGLHNLANAESSVP